MKELDFYKTFMPSIKNECEASERMDITIVYKDKMCAANITSIEIVIEYANDDPSEYKVISGNTNTYIFPVIANDDLYIISYGIKCDPCFLYRMSSGNVRIRLVKKGSEFYTGWMTVSDFATEFDMEWGDGDMTKYLLPLHSVQTNTVDNLKTGTVKVRMPIYLYDDIKNYVPQSKMVKEKCNNEEYVILTITSGEFFAGTLLQKWIDRSLADEEAITCLKGITIDISKIINTYMRQYEEQKLCLS